jgi:hypothetical protein
MGVVLGPQNVTQPLLGLLVRATRGNRRGCVGAGDPALWKRVGVMRPSMSGSAAAGRTARRDSSWLYTSDHGPVNDAGLPANYHNPTPPGGIQVGR